MTWLVDAVMVGFPVGLLLLVRAHARHNARVTRSPNFPFGYTFKSDVRGTEDDQ